MLPEAAKTDAKAKGYLTSIYATLWDEFAKPWLNQGARNEAGFFWEALEEEAPDLVTEARQRHRLGQQLDGEYEIAKREALAAARGFFTVANEEVRVRPLAIQMGYLSAAARVDRGSHGQLQVTCQDDPAGQTEGLRSARDEDGYVRGAKRAPFPRDGPDCKYSALFDPRPAFDGLREAFMVRRLFLSLLEAQVVDGASKTFHASVRQWLATAAPSDEPADFGPRAWKAYLACVRNAKYYLSVGELVAICQQASVRVLIFKEIDGGLILEAFSLAGRGPLILTKLTANKERSVRSHFERLVAVTEMNHFNTIVDQEAEARSQEDARLRQERETEEEEERQARVAEKAEKARAEKARREAEERQARVAAAAAAKASEDVPPPPPASDGIRPAKKQKSQDAGQNPEQAEADLVPGSSLQPDEAGRNKSDEGAGQYNVRCMPCGASADPRRQLEAAMTTLVAQGEEIEELQSVNFCEFGDVKV
jgi:hypothetical protein